MVTSFEKLLEFLVERVALCGYKGASQSDFELFLKEFYGKDENEDENRDITPSTVALRSSQKIDDQLEQKFWSLLLLHPDIQSQSGDDQSHAGCNRVRASVERIWQAVAGHGEDFKKISPLEFELLSIIAAHGTLGMLQPKLTALSGQDKRSVPKRTDSLAQKGYILKQSALTRGSRTSLCILRKFVTPAVETHTEIVGDDSLLGSRDQTHNTDYDPLVSRKIPDHILVSDDGSATLSESRDKMDMSIEIQSTPTNVTTQLEPTTRRKWLQRHRSPRQMIPEPDKHQSQLERPKNGRKQELSRFTTDMERNYISEWYKRTEQRAYQIVSDEIPYLTGNRRENGDNGGVDDLADATRKRRTRNVSPFGNFAVCESSSNSMVPVLVASNRAVKRRKLNPSTLQLQSSLLQNDLEAESLEYISSASLSNFEHEANETEVSEMGITNGKRAALSAKNPTDAHEISKSLQSQATAKTFVKRVKEIQKELLAMELPGVYINPPNSLPLIQVQAMPQKFLIIVIKSDKLRKFGWFKPLRLTDDHFQSQNVMKCQKLMQTATVAGQTRSVGYGESSHAYPPLSDQETTSLATVVSGSIMRQSSKRASLGTKGVRIGGGLVTYKPSMIIMDILNQAGGVYPGNDELRYAFATAWDRISSSSANAQPEWPTIDRAVKNLVRSSKIKKFTFYFEEKSGVRVMKHILAKMELTPESEIVKSLERSMIDAHPRMFLPESVDVLPELLPGIALSELNRAEKPCIIPETAGNPYNLRRNAAVIESRDSDANHGPNTTKEPRLASTLTSDELDAPSNMPKYFQNSPMSLPNSLADIISEKANKREPESHRQRPKPSNERLFWEVDRVQRWEERHHDALTSLSPLSQARFINHGYDIFHDTAKSNSEDGIEMQPIELPTSPQKQRRLRRSTRKVASKDVDDVILNIDTPTVNEDPSTQIEDSHVILRKKFSRAKGAILKRRNPVVKSKRTETIQNNVIMSQVLIQRLIMVVCMVRILTGGVERTTDWNLVKEILNDSADPLTVRARYGYHLRQYGPYINRLEKEFQDRFLIAYENGEISTINFQNLDLCDWESLLKWMQLHISVVTNNGDQTLPNDRESFEEQFNLKPDEIHEAPIDDCYAILTTTVRREEILSDFAFSIPLRPAKLAGEIGSRQSSRNKPSQFDPVVVLGVAESYVRANVLTSSSNYNARAARSKLQPLGDHALEQAIKSLVKSDILRQEIKGRLDSFRHYTIPDRVFNLLSRAFEKNSTFQAATRHKIILDETLSTIKSTAFSFHGGDGDVIPTLDLIADGKLRIDIVLPEIAVDNDEPGDGSKLSVWGFTVGNYKSTQMDRSNLVFDLRLSLAGTYDTANSKREVLPPPPSSHVGQKGQPIPIWYDIHDKVLPDMWDSILTTAVTSIVLRPGATAQIMSKRCKGFVGAWEFELVLDWLARLDAARKLGDGWIALPGWWRVFGPGTDDEAGAA